MLMLTRRLQILMDEERYERLAARAAARGASVATLVREAIDTSFPPVEPRRAAAAAALLAAEPMPVPEPHELRQELAELRARHG